MKIFTSAQVKEIDEFTIMHEPIRSIDLMERAAEKLYYALLSNFLCSQNNFLIICGQGNNGGDGLALARLFNKSSFDCHAVYCNFSDDISDDCKVNLMRLKQEYPDFITIIENEKELSIDKNHVIIDCIFGTGLNRPVAGKYKDLIYKINTSENKIVAIDIPSGVFGEDNSQNDGAKINADLTLTIEFPPLSSMFPENYSFFGDLQIVDIDLHLDAINKTSTNYHIVDQDFVKGFLPLRHPFSHKGNYGHALIVAGSCAKAGAAVLATKACLRTGAGLVTTHVPKSICEIIQNSAPEAMISIDRNLDVFSGLEKVQQYNALALGPGLGIEKETEKAVFDLLKTFKGSIVIDADGLNVLSKQKGFIKTLSRGTILTPHPKEFERLFGVFNNTYEKLKFMQKTSQEYGIIIVLKGGVTSISLPDGNIVFNSSHNPGMATGGSGDVLTGIIAGLLAQNLSPENAAVLGVYLHSLAGKYARRKFGEESLIAGDLVKCLPKAFRKLKRENSMFD